MVGEVSRNNFKKIKKYFRITNDKFYLKCYGLLLMITRP